MKRGALPADPAPGAAQTKAGVRPLAGPRRRQAPCGRGRPCAPNLAAAACLELVLRYPPRASTRREAARRTRRQPGIHPSPGPAPPAAGPHLSLGHGQEAGSAGVRTAPGMPAQEASFRFHLLAKNLSQNSAPRRFFTTALTSTSHFPLKFYRACVTSAEEILAFRFE